MRHLWYPRVCLGFLLLFKFMLFYVYAILHIWVLSLYAALVCLVSEEAIECFVTEVTGGHKRALAVWQAGLPRSRSRLPRAAPGLQHQPSLIKAAQSNSL